MTARFLTAFTLAFHIIFAVLGITMPLLMVIAEGMWLKTKDKSYLILAKQWGKATAVLFGIGAVSGTVISFELVLLWPKFMEFAGPVIGFPFALEGFAFFVEAVFLGIYLYGWDRVSPGFHWFSGIMTALGGSASGVLVMTANAWMNTPRGFTLENGHAANINVITAMLNPASFTEVPHMMIAAFQSAAIAVAALHAYYLLRNQANPFHRRAFAIAFSVAAAASLIMPLSGDHSARFVARHEPVKLASMEGHWETIKGAPLNIGGLPDEDAEVTRFAIRIPYGLSLLAERDPMAEIMGLKQIPKENRPFVPLVHVAFQIMVPIGFYLMALGGLGFFLFLKKKSLPVEPWFLKTVFFSGPLGFVALETGWIVTEVGRQPWIIANIMRTRDAVTDVPYLTGPLVSFVLIYALLAVTLVAVMKRIIKGADAQFNSPQ
ncbi:MAG: cytochrome ubiquinol oxidase subunit I [Elusimicrobia bacterium]|nr:cytochrome ubiquinol oxidase subunit I [Candidatus Obscuribacterium magneticum]